MLEEITSSRLGEKYYRYTHSRALLCFFTR